MKTITANLKLLYQKPEMWIWYFLNGIIIIMIMISINDSVHIDNKPVGWCLFIMPLLNLSMVGSAMGRLVVDVWNKHTFFCLPRQIETSMKMLSLMGLATCIITFVVMLSIFSWTKVGFLSGSIMLISYYLMIYWLSVIISIWLYRVVFIISFFALFIPGIINYYGINYIFENLPFNHIWISTFIFLIISCIIYHALTRKSLVRFLVAAPRLMLFFGWKNAVLNSYESSHLRKNSHIDQFSKFIDYFFCEHIKSNNCSLTLPIIWGRVYISFRFMISNYRRIFSACLLVFFCTLIFINDKRLIDLQPYFFSLFGVLGGHMCLMYGSGILLPISRKGQFFCGITAFMTSIFSMLILAAAFVLFSNILSATKNFTSFIFFLRSEYIPFDGKYIFLSVIVLPATAGLLLLFRKKAALSMIAIIILALFLLAFNLYIVDNGGYIFNMFNLFFIFLLTVLSFGFYLAILYYDSMKRSLC